MSDLKPFRQEALIVRPVEPRDNPALLKLVQGVLTEHGCVGQGFAYADPELTMMYETYQEPGSAYWVIEDPESNQIMGGSGFSRLKGTTEAEAVCELQKLYFYPELRGMGFGRRLIELCMAEATRAGYKEMYLETVHNMKNAITLYEKFGFETLDGPMGATGHTKCTIFMSRPLVVEPESCAV